MYKMIPLIFLTLIIPTWTLKFNCELPIGCEVNDIHYPANYLGDGKTTMQIQGILCNVRDENFQFNYSKPSPLIKRCQIFDELVKETIEIRFHRDLILGKWFNINNMLNYGSLFKANINLNYVNLKGFELDIINNDFNQGEKNLITDYFYYLNCIKCTIAFYSNDRQIKTCDEITNTTRIMSLFQFSNPAEELILILFDPQFKTKICPLMFKNSLFYIINLIGLTDTFYKRNLLIFENRLFNDLKSKITILELKGENINIDSNLLNPSVFKYITEIHINGKVNNIDGGSLNEFKQLTSIIFSKEHFRDMIHKNGIKWMRDLNPNLNLNLSSFEEIKNYYYKYVMMIKVYCSIYNPEIRLSRIFPDEDFCLYKDFPFNHLVIMMEHIPSNKVYILLKTREYTCTYLWFTQYFDKFIQLQK